MSNDRHDAVFEYVGFEIEPAADLLACTYRVGGHEFREEVVFPGGGDWAHPAVPEAARIVFLLAGVSYYKAFAPDIIDLGPLPVTESERTFLHGYYLNGLGEFAYRNGIDLDGLTILGGKPRTVQVEYRPEPGRPLIPFGGGIDSIVSVELLRDRSIDPSLFVVNRREDRFAAIEAPAAVTALPVRRAERTIDPTILRSRELGFLNGHVPVTGIISAIAVMSAVLDGRDSVVMSNEWSASSATLQVGDRLINHQWSKSAEFESDFRALVAGAIGPGLEYFSLLRPFTELWIAKRFATHPQYLDHFRSCNRAFHIDPALRLDHWCGECDKCCFIDLVLAPFVDEPALARVFGGHEPLANAALRPTFDGLLGLTPDQKPWECVGDVSESRVAARLASQRPDRASNALLGALVADAERFHDSPVDVLLRPVGSHNIPDRYAPDAVLV